MGVYAKGEPFQKAQPDYGKGREVWLKSSGGNELAINKSPVPETEKATVAHFVLISFLLISNIIGLWLASTHDQWRWYWALTLAYCLALPHLLELAEVLWNWEPPGGPSTGGSWRQPLPDWPILWKYAILTLVILSLFLTLAQFMLGLLQVYMFSMDSLHTKAGFDMTEADPPPPYRDISFLDTDTDLPATSGSRWSGWTIYTTGGIWQRLFWRHGTLFVCIMFALGAYRLWVPRCGQRTTSNMVNHLNKLLITTGYLEPPLELGQTCGERFTLDYPAFTPEFVHDYAARGVPGFIGDEHEIPGMRQYVTRNEMFGLRFIDGEETQQTSLDGETQKFIFPRPLLWFNRVYVRLRAMLAKPLEQSTLPQHGVKTTATHSSQGTPAQPQRLLHLLTSMRSAQLGKGLHQGCIDAIKTDRQLFNFLRDLYKSKRGQLHTLLSLKTVKGIHVVRFNLFAGGAVEVRHHKECCKQDCACVPPASLVEPSDQAEYQCYPTGPLKYGPPILPEVLAHFYSSPSCIPEHARSVLDRLPIRIVGELQEPVGEPAEGWGIYFHEGLDSDIITLLVCIVFIAGSLIFGILWSYLEMDVQGAFGVSAYILTTGAILVSLVAMKTNKA